MQKDLTQAAINAALSGNWSQALEINLQILGDDTKNVDALNRLARAYAETGNLISARKYAKSALKIDPYNTIAQKCLDKWKGLKKGDTYKSGPSSAHIFLEEPGKTKIVSLLHVGSSKILARLDAGDELKLNTRGHRVTVCSQDGKYVGRVPDDLSARHISNQFKLTKKTLDCSFARPCV
jgi:tetratricopeptide (TPR) repeat protein